jgi:hypothetical protein
MRAGQAIALGHQGTARHPASRHTGEPAQWQVWWCASATIVLPEAHRPGCSSRSAKQHLLRATFPREATECPFTTQVPMVTVSQDIITHFCSAESSEVSIVARGGAARLVHRATQRDARTLGAVLDELVWLLSFSRQRADSRRACVLARRARTRDQMIHYRTGSCGMV